jgi:hypothetical protein
MSTDLDSYRQALLVALRLRDVPGVRIADALAEVDSHVAESGEDPEEAFGPPGEYATRIADTLAPERPRGLLAAVKEALFTWTTWAAMIGGFLLADGMFNLGFGADAVLGLPAPLAVALGVVLLGAVAVRFRFGEQDLVIDPRTGEDLVGPMPKWVLLVVYGGPVLAFLGLYLAGRLLR